MKCTIPEISWHNRDPVLTVDVQPSNKSESFERLATGGTDSHVVIWHVEMQDAGVVKVEFAADLQRHQKAVNVVRFSPSGEFLASGDDEVSHHHLEAEDGPGSTRNAHGGCRQCGYERAMAVGSGVLRGHVEDVYDLSWSPDSSQIISGSVDNSAILWDVHKGRNLGILREHKGFVQGVTWDPNNQYVATLSSDRTCRVYNVNNKKLVCRVSKAQLPVPESSELHGKVVRIFHDDTLKSFFRRLCFSPDGQLLIAPSGIIENPNSDKPTNATFIFTRRMLNRPSVYLPTNNQYTVAVRCCPLLFELRDRESVFALPYRMVLAVATQTSVLLYDTQQPEPFGIISNIHYTRLTDLTWSSDGKLLIVSSTDGYCSIITFAPGELGVVYEPQKNVSSKEAENDSAGTTDKKTADDKGIAVTKTSEDLGNQAKNETHKNADSSKKNMNMKQTPCQPQLDKGTKVQNAEISKEKASSLLKSPVIPDKVETFKNKLEGNKSSDSEITIIEKPENVLETTKEKSENVKTSDLEKTPENFKIFGKTGNKNTKQQKTPRRITPIMLSSPRKAQIGEAFKVKNVPRKLSSYTVSPPKKVLETSHEQVSENNLSPLLSAATSCEIVTKPLILEDSVQMEEDISNRDTSLCSKVTSEKENDSSKNEILQCDTTITKQNQEAKPGTPKGEVSPNESSELKAPTNTSSDKPSSSCDEPEAMETDSCAIPKSKLESTSSAVSPLPATRTPSQEKKTPRRVQLITLSSPKSKKKLL